MSVQLNFTKGVGHTLIPFDQDTADYIEKIKTGTAICWPKPKKLRDPVSHKKYFVMIGLSWEHLAEHAPWKTKRAWRKALEIAAGHYEPGTIMLDDGELVEVRHPKSISYESLDQDAFDELRKGVYEQLMGNYRMWLNLTPGQQSEFEENFNR